MPQLLPRTALEQWGTLAAVVDHGGFAQAAEALHKSQSAVSYAVSRLQECLDLPLLAIEGRKAALTEHGRLLLARVRPLLRDLHQLELQAQQLKQGWEPELALVVDLAFPRERLLAVLAELQTLCPATQVRLSDAVLSGAEEAITEKLADVVVTAHVPAGFLGDHLIDVEFVAVAAPSHPLFEIEEPLTTAHLERHAQVVVHDSGSRKPRDEGWLGANRRFTVSSMEASHATVRAGLGFAWLPVHITRNDLAEGALRVLPLAQGGARSVSLSVVLVKGTIAGPAARAALECLKRHVPGVRSDAGLPENSGD